jgi:hypothetical protein
MDWLVEAGLARPGGARWEWVGPVRAGMAEHGGAVRGWAGHAKAGVARSGGGPLGMERDGGFSENGPAERIYST